MNECLFSRSYFNLLQIMIEVVVKTLNGDNFNYSVPEDATVENFKSMIAEKMSIPINLQRLIYQGRALENAKLLAEYDVHEKVVHLVQRPGPPVQNPLPNAADTQPIIVPNVDTPDTAQLIFTSVLQPDFSALSRRLQFELHPSINIVEEEDRIVVDLENFVMLQNGKVIRRKHEKIRQAITTLETIIEQLERLWNKSEDIRSENWISISEDDDSSSSLNLDRDSDTNIRRITDPTFPSHAELFARLTQLQRTLEPFYNAYQQLLSDDLDYDEEDNILDKTIEKEENEVNDEEEEKKKKKENEEDSQMNSSDGVRDIPSIPTTFSTESRITIGQMSNTDDNRWNKSVRAQTFCSLVHEAIHTTSHAYHSLSEIELDFISQSPPRMLRPIEGTTVDETQLPLFSRLFQSNSRTSNIRTRGRRNDNQNNSNIVPDMDDMENNDNNLSTSFRNHHGRIRHPRSLSTRISNSRRGSEFPTFSLFDDSEFEITIPSTQIGGVISQPVISVATSLPTSTSISNSNGEMSGASYLPFNLLNSTLNQTVTTTQTSNTMPTNTGASTNGLHRVAGGYVQGMIHALGVDSNGNQIHHNRVLDPSTLSSMINSLQNLGPNNQFNVVGMPTNFSSNASVSTTVPTSLTTTTSNIVSSAPNNVSGITSTPSLSSSSQVPQNVNMFVQMDGGILSGADMPPFVRLRSSSIERPPTVRYPTTSSNNRIQRTSTIVQPMTIEDGDNRVRIINNCCRSRYRPSCIRPSDIPSNTSREALPMYLKRIFNATVCLIGECWSGLRRIEIVRGRPAPLRDYPNWAMINFRHNISALISYRALSRCMPRFITNENMANGLLLRSSTRSQRIPRIRQIDITERVHFSLPRPVRTSATIPSSSISTTSSTYTFTTTTSSTTTSTGPVPSTSSSSIPENNIHHQLHHVVHHLNQLCSNSSTVTSSSQQPMITTANSTPIDGSISITSFGISPNVTISSQSALPPGFLQSIPSFLNNIMSNISTSTFTVPSSTITTSLSSSSSSIQFNTNVTSTMVPTMSTSTANMCPTRESAPRMTISSAPLSTTTTRRPIVTVGASGENVEANVPNDNNRLTNNKRRPNSISEDDVSPPRSRAWESSVPADWLEQIQFDTQQNQQIDVDDFSLPYIEGIENRQKRLLLQNLINEKKSGTDDPMIKDFSFLFRFLYSYTNFWMDVISFKIKVLDGKEIKIDVAKNTTLDEFKNKIEDECQVPRYLQRLLYKGKVVKENDDLPEGGNIFIVRRAGGPNIRPPSMRINNRQSMNRQVFRRKITRIVVSNWHRPNLRRMRTDIKNIYGDRSPVTDQQINVMVCDISEYLYQEHAKEIRKSHLMIKKTIDVMEKLVDLLQRMFDRSIDIREEIWPAPKEYEIEPAHENVTVGLMPSLLEKTENERRFNRRTPTLVSFGKLFKSLHAAERLFDPFLIRYTEILENGEEYSLKPFDNQNESKLKDKQEKKQEDELVAKGKREKLDKLVKIGGNNKNEKNEHSDKKGKKTFMQKMKEKLFKNGKSSEGKSLKRNSKDIPTSSSIAPENTNREILDNSNNKDLRPSISNTETRLHSTPDIHPLAIGSISDITIDEEPIMNIGEATKTVGKPWCEAVRNQICSFMCLEFLHTSAHTYHSISDLKVELILQKPPRLNLQNPQLQFSPETTDLYSFLQKFCDANYTSNIMTG
ncbi:hypothetical protein SNEBB_002755 [Seison nebaliae]|nr:hypothetical protein SNEBB_002755 [Seison nebaliae]